MRHMRWGAGIPLGVLAAAIGLGAIASGAVAAGIGGVIGVLGGYGSLAELYVRTRSKRDVREYLSEGRERALLERAGTTNLLSPSSPDGVRSDSEEA